MRVTRLLDSYTPLWTRSLLDLAGSLGARLIWNVREATEREGANRLGVAADVAAGFADMSGISGRLSSIYATAGRLFNGRDECRVIVVGLDGSGKTTIVHRLKHGKAHESSIIRARACHRARRPCRRALS